MQASAADAPMQDMGERIRGGRFLIFRLALSGWRVKLLKQPAEYTIIKYLAWIKIKSDF